MEQLFHKGQRVVCVDTPKHAGLRFGLPCDLIAGKSYHVTNPCLEVVEGKVMIRLAEAKHGYNQEYFVPEDFDRYADNELHQALKGIPETL